MVAVAVGLVTVVGPVGAVVVTVYAVATAKGFWLLPLAGAGLGVVCTFAVFGSVYLRRVVVAKAPR